MKFVKNLFFFFFSFTTLCGAPAFASEPMGSYVGELQEKWQFPSDHLPIGVSFNGIGIVSWNVLDAEYIGWVIDKNSQGLSRSMIADLHIFIGRSKLTLRDRYVADMILQMINHPTHPKMVLCLQECSKPFIQYLAPIIPEYFKIVPSHGNAILIDCRYFERSHSSEIAGVFGADQRRSFQDIYIRRLDNRQLLRIINAHLPGDPTKPAPDEFADYLANTFNPKVSTVVMGDMNFNEQEMGNGLIRAFGEHLPFSIHSPYCTNVSPYVFKSKAIDHFLIYQSAEQSVELNHPAEILPNLERIVQLLTP